MTKSLAIKNKKIVEKIDEKTVDDQSARDIIMQMLDLEVSRKQHRKVYRSLIEADVEESENEA